MQTEAIATETTRHLKSNAYYLAPAIPLVLLAAGVDQLVFFHELAYSAFVTPFVMYLCANLMEKRREKDATGRPIRSTLVLFFWLTILLVPTAVVIYLLGVMWSAERIEPAVKLIATMTTALMSISTTALSVTCVKSYLYDGQHVRERRRRRRARD